jgi:MYXO-CTERM domain-containing protein
VFDPGSVTDLLVVYDVTVTSVSSTTEAGLGHGWPWLLLLLLLVPLRRVRRRGFAVLALLALALAPLACGGGGGGANGPFDPTGVSVTFQVTLDENGIDATTPTLGPAGPLQLPTADIASSTLMVSN